MPQAQNADAEQHALSEADTMDMNCAQAPLVLSVRLGCRLHARSAML
jgi:hypothetical protein